MEPTPGHPPRSSPSPARKNPVFCKPEITFQPAMLMVTATPKFGEKNNKNCGIRHLEDLDEINQNISRCQKNTPMKIVGKVIFPSRRSPGNTPKHHPSHLQTFSRRRRCFRPGHPQHQSSPMSVFSHFVGKWNGVNCTTALAMPGFGQSSASSALPSSALPLGEGLSGIPSQFPTFAT